MINVIVRFSMHIFTSSLLHVSVFVLVFSVVVKYLTLKFVHLYEYGPQRPGAVAMTAARVS